MTVFNIDIRPVASSRLTAGLLAAAALLTLAPPTAHAAAFDGYGQNYRPVSLPGNGPGSFGLAGDALADGRLVAMTGRSLYVESQPGSGAFQPVAVFDATVLAAGAGADPAFLRVSPDGQRLAIGMGVGKPIAIVPVAALGTPGAPANIAAATPGVTLYRVPHTEAAWRTPTELALTAGEFGQASRVTLLDTTSDPASPRNPAVITNIGGASAGVGFDAAGRLYTGNGFDLATGGGASTTGAVRAFDPAAWASGPADFETGGTLIGDVLSASSLLFDADGNLLVSGGDFAEGDTGYVGLIHHAAIASALAGGGPVSRDDAGAFKRLAPRADPFAFYGAAYNRATGEVYAAFGDFTTGDNTWYATIPAPAALALSLPSLALAARRRR